jgi:hypothetical protein
VCLLAASYTEVLELARSALEPDERDPVLALTAASVYRLPGLEAADRQT